MKPSQKTALACAAVCALLTVGIYWLWPHFYWWVYLLIWLGTSSLVTNETMRFEADRKIVDRD